MLRRHAVFLAMLVAAAVLRIITAEAYRPALMFYGDSFSYLTNALHLAPAFFRPVGYSIFLWPFLHGHALPAVPVVQHLMGLGIGVGVYALLYRLGAGAWSCLGAAPVLFDGYQLNVEQFILSETLFTALVVAAVLLVVWRTRPGPIVSMLAGAALAGASITRTVGVVLIVPLLIYLVARRAKFIAVLVAPCVFAVGMIAYASWYQADRGRIALTGADGYFLYGRVATFEDCSRLPSLPREEWVLCDPRPPSERPSANAYIWGAFSAQTILSVQGKVAHNRVLEDFAIRVIKSQPLDYFRVVLGDVAHYFSPFRHTGPQDEPIEIWQFPKAAPFDRRVYGRIPAKFGVVDSTPAVRTYGSAARWLGSYQKVVYSGPIMLLALILGLAGLFVGGPGGARRRLRAECFLLVSFGLAILVVPAMTAMFDFRYMVPTLTLIPPAGVLGGLAVARRVAAWRRGPGAAVADEPSTDEAPELQSEIGPPVPAAEEPALP